MLRTISNYIAHHHLFPEQGKSALVGLSGGADSVALLAVLVRLGYSCTALHVNFHLRGEESLRDQSFAASFAAQMNVPFHKTDFDTTAYAAQHHLSIETAARELRYRWFEEMRQQLGAQAIAVAHHRDDNAETLLMNLLRGSGIHGLSGIPPRNGFVVRPLLALSRQDILSWLQQQGYTYVTDSSNLSDACTRNYIRLHVLPLLENLNPAAKQSIARTAEHLSDAALLYDHLIRQAAQDIISGDIVPGNPSTALRLDIPALLRYPAPQTILYELLKPYGFQRPQVRGIYRSLSSQSGKTFYAGAYRLIKDRSSLLLSEPAALLPPPDTAYLIPSPDATTHLPIPLTLRLLPASSPDTACSPGAHTCSFDADKVIFPLTLRRWRKGDWFVPSGMKGRQKLSNYFTDHKFSRLQKENVWLLCSGEAILRIIGHRTDARFLPTPLTTTLLSVNSE